MKTLDRMLFLVVAFSHLFAQIVGASDGAEVFDIKKGEIILTIKNSNSLQNQVKEWLSSANGTVGSLKIEPSDGIAIKITLMPPYKVNNDWITGTVTEVVMFISPSKTYFPTLLVFTNEKGLVAVHVKTHSLKTFLKKNKLFNPELNLKHSYYYKFSNSSLSVESPMSESVTLLLDQTKPVTALALAGTVGNGWYTSDVTVTLNATDDLSGVVKTEYKIGDSEDWKAYSGPYALTQDGTYTIQYRSTDRAGNVEDTKQQAFKLDKTLPSFKLIANGNELKEGDSFEDYLPLTFQASDNMSGLVSAQISVSDSVYTLDLTKGPSVVIDLAGKAGNYTAVITAEDAAGNKLQKNFQINVTTSINSMNQLLNRYNALLNKALVNQLSNNLIQAQHQLDINRPDQAAKHMQDFVKHLNNAALGEDVDRSVKAILNTDANALIKQWSGV